MSRPFPYPSVKKDNEYFDDFMANVLASCVDLHRSVGQFQLVTAPSSSTASGTYGMCAIDDDYFYVCISTDTWVRTALLTW